jgi:predicted O-methyltransferase YrrM
MAFTYRSSDDPLLRALPGRLGEVMSFHADQKPREKILLYATVFAFAPERVLEIGVRWGGGSRIIHSALTDLGRGRHVGLDPEPVVEFDWSIIADRSTLIVGRSPDDLPKARDAAGGLFDFAFVDGDHSFEGVKRDIEGIRPFLAPGAAILLHDAYHPPVARAIALAPELGYTPGGMLARTRNDGVHVESGRIIPYGGVELLRWQLS